MIVLVALEERPLIVFEEILDFLIEILNLVRIRRRNIAFAAEFLAEKEYLVAKSKWQQHNIRSVNGLNRPFRTTVHDSPSICPQVE